MFLSNGGAISWTSKRQSTVALSTVEAEYIALASTCQEAMWLKQLIEEIESIAAKKPMQIYSDNNGAISLSKNACVSQRSKHIDVRYHFIREKVENKRIKIGHVCTEQMIADMFTKALSKPKIQSYMSSLGLIM